MTNECLHVQVVVVANKDRLARFGVDIYNEMSSIYLFNYSLTVLALFFLQMTNECLHEKRALNRAKRGGM